MRLYDRYNAKLVDSAKLPAQIDLGRYYVPETGADITNRILNVGADKIIRQGILESTNRSIQDLFCQFYHTVGKSETDQFAVRPLIQSVKDKLFLNDFEKLLEDKIFHLEEIFRQPHYMLNRTIEKVNVSRAKRIPAKSYQNLASHTEDWLQKSIVNFKPRRILNEELDLLYDVYENQAAVALVERCLLYLGSRIKEVHDIREFLDVYKKILSDRDDENGWWKKINRNLSLIGDVYEDENYNKDVDRSSVLTRTKERLSQMQKRLKTLQGQLLYNEVNKRIVLSLLSERDIKPTNVMANHKHYRYVRELWIALNTISKERSEEERLEYEQQVISGVRCYAKSLITYFAKDVFSYGVKGIYSDWVGEHDYFCPLSLKEDPYGRIELMVDKTKLTFVIIASECAEVIDVDLPPNTYILSLEYKGKNDRVIRISPYDVDSVERVGAVIKSYMIRNFVNILRQRFDYPHNLRDFVDCIHADCIHFNNDFTYSYIGLTFDELSSKTAVEQLFMRDNYKQKSRTEKEAIKSGIESLICDINRNGQALSNKILCLDCMTPIQRRKLQRLNYIQCDCGFVLDSTKQTIVYGNKDEKYKGLKREDWGMDYIKFNF